VKPSPFKYFAPTTVDECLALLAEHGDDAKLLAGGQSLVPLMNLRLAAPEVVIDLNAVADLAGARIEGDRLVVGAMTRHRDVAGADVIGRAAPMLAHAAAMIGYPAIRNRGTLGGSLVHADATAEMPCVALTLDAELVVAGPDGRRTISAADFFVSHFMTTIEPSELLVEVRFDARADGWEFLEFSRKSGDFAVAAVAVDILRGNGRVERVRIGVAGVGDRPWRAERAEAAVHAGEPFEEAAAGAGEQAAAISDGYRSHVVATLTRRALETAMNVNGGAT
jgi:aerobic carbon-monoxide dehydrogenase medium subunit